MFNSCASRFVCTQILNNSVCPPLFGLALLCAGQLSTLNGSAAGQVVSEAFFDYQIHPWQHRILIRGLSLVPVATCVYLNGNEGVYHMVIFSQVFLALHLPFTVAPLIKLTSSEPIMGSGKNSFFLETAAWLSLGVLGVVNVTLIFDLVFGDTQDGASFGGLEYLPGFDWLTEIWGESLQSLVFAFVCAGTTLSLGFLVWLIFTPLQSETQFTHSPTRPSWIEDYARQEEEALNARPSIHNAFAHSFAAKIIVQSDESLETHVNDLPLVAVTHDDSEMLQVKSKGEVGADSSYPAKIQDFPQRLHLGSSDDVSFQNHISSPSPSPAIRSPLFTPPGFTTSSVSAAKALAIHQALAGEDTDALALKKAEAEADADAELIGKDDDEMDAWGSLEQENVLADAHCNRNVFGNTCSLNLDGPLDGPISGRSDTSFGTEGGSGSGSLSRLSGLGRAARRQFALILDEFWATLFDLHGQPIAPHSQGGCQAILDEGNDGQKSHSKQLASTWKKQRDMNCPSRSRDANVLLASTSSQLSQAHPQDVYTSERRYLSMQMPVYHEDYDHQPATIHGYPTPSFPWRAGSLAASYKARSISLRAPLFRSQTSPDHVHESNTDTSFVGQEYPYLVESRQPMVSAQWVTDDVGHGCVRGTKGSDIHLTQSEKYLVESETSSYDASRWDPLVSRSRDSSIGKWDPLVYRATGELDISSGVGVPNEFNGWPNFGHSPIGRGGTQSYHVESTPLVFDELSPSQLHRDAFSIQTPTSRSETHSLWSRQPFEQLFGATDADGRASHVRKQIRSGSHVVQLSESDSTVAGAGENEVEVLEKLHMCLGKLLRLDGADWLFRRDSGADEDLITAIAISQKTSADAEVSELQRSLGNQDIYLSERNGRSLARRSCNDSIPSRRQRNATPNCGKDCIWDRSLLVSFGVWSVHRVLELSLMESRPELWGKYTYVLNRLQV